MFEVFIALLWPSGDLGHAHLWSYSEMYKHWESVGSASHDHTSSVWPGVISCLRLTFSLFSFFHGFCGVVLECGCRSCWLRSFWHFNILTPTSSYCSFRGFSFNTLSSPRTLVLILVLYSVLPASGEIPPPRSQHQRLRKEMRGDRPGRDSGAQLL